MKKQMLQAFCMTLLFNLPTYFTLQAQTISTSIVEYVEKVKISASTITFEFNDAYQNFTVEISGPNQFYLKKELTNTNNWILKKEGFDTKTFQDGSYAIQVTPNFKQSLAEQKILRYLTETDQQAQLKAKKELLDIPNQVEKYNRIFSILDGEFVLPRNEQYGLKLPEDNSDPTTNLSSLKLATNTFKPTFTNLNLNENPNTISADYLGLNPQPMFIAQVFATDLIVQGSGCIGFDCVSSESFGFDTGRYKENNLRIHFDDTSNSASFASNDWRIAINGTGNGDPSYFAIEDATAGRTPFKIEAGAIANALYVDAEGDVGIGTATPVVEAHLVDGNTPTLRLEQDGSSGFTSQTWDLASNETNFFIRDVTNGSKLPFRIRPGALESSIDIASNGEVGIGNASPAARLHIKGLGNDNTSNAFLAANSDGTILFKIQDDGQVTLDQYLGASFDNASPSFALTLDGSGNVTKTAYSGGVGTDDQTLSEVLTQGNTANSDIAMGDNKITSLADPTALQDAATKNYVDNISVVDADADATNELITNFSLSGKNVQITDAGGTKNLDLSGIADTIWLKEDNNIPSNIADNIYTMGKVAIGLNVTPEQELHVVGNIAISGAILPVSDIRLKKDIQPIANGLTTIQALNPTTYHFRTAQYADMKLPETLQYGFIAQELEKILPALVTNSDNLDKAKAFKRVNYTGVIPFLVKGMQEQQEIIEDQQAEIDVLKAKLKELDELKQQVATLAKMMESPNSYTKETAKSAKK